MRSTQSFFRTIFRTVFRTGLLAGLAGITAAACQAQTSVALGLYGAFNGATSGRRHEAKSSQPGGRAGRTPADQKSAGRLRVHVLVQSSRPGNLLLSRLPSPPCPMTGCPVSTASYFEQRPRSDGDWVVSFRAANLRPFALAGGGLLLNMPSGGTVTTTTCGTVNPLCSRTTTAAATSTSVAGVFVYGAGLDWELLPHSVSVCSTAAIFTRRLRLPTRFHRRMRLPIRPSR